jgi:osmotically-inducible protein OsmY
MAPPKDIREAAKKAKDIREAVQKELDFDPVVDSAGITVKNLNGDVALNGTVPAYPQYVEAAAAARRVQGVTKVHNHLMVVLLPSHYRDDVMLTTAANNALALNVTVPPGSVEASASGGDVWLTGVVGSGFQRAAAEQTIAGLTGVRGIINDIEVFSEVEAADVTMLIQDAIDRYALVGDDSDVRAAASDGTVILTGHVHSWPEHDVVIDAAWMGIGVRNVRDELVITG